MSNTTDSNYEGLGRRLNPSCEYDREILSERGVELNEYDREILSERVGPTTAPRKRSWDDYCW